MTGTISLNGVQGTNALLFSETPGSPATISKASEIVEFSYMTITAITATGGATFNAHNSIDGGGNTGINFIAAGGGGGSGGAYGDYGRAYGYG